MQIVPTQAMPSQSLSITLANQSVNLNIYTKGINNPALYMDVYLAGALLLAGVACRNATAIIRDDYFGFIGDFAFYDTQGLTDPQYAGLGTRYFLAYLSPGDVLNTEVQTIAG